MRRRAVMILAMMAAVPLVVAAAMGPVRRGPGFHRYADDRAWLGIPNALDVLSNLPFVIVGAVVLLRVCPRVRKPGLRWIATACAVATIGIGVGSAAYHAVPRDETLLFDWIPIVVLVQLLAALVMADRVGWPVARVAAWVMPVVSTIAVVVWYVGGGTQGGDMRWYAALQVQGVVLVPSTLLLFPRGGLRGVDLWAALACFGAMRLLTAHDADVLRATGVISGHSLKHLVAALGAALALRSLRGVSAAR